MIPGWCVVLALYPQNTQKCERASRRNLCYAPGFEGALCGQRKLQDTIVVSPPSSTNRNISTSESQGLDIGWGDAVISISVWHGQYSNCIQVQLLVITAYLLQLVTLWSAHPLLGRRHSPSKTCWAAVVVQCRNVMSNSFAAWQWS